MLVSMDVLMLLLLKIPLTSQRIPFQNAIDIIQMRSHKVRQDVHHLGINLGIGPAKKCLDARKTFY